MTKKRSILSTSRKLHAVMLAAAMTLASAAWSSDAPPPDEPTGPLTRLQHLTGRASELAVRAMGMVGIRYKYGGDSPESGLDCSGLVRHVFKEAWGARLPRTSEEISRFGSRIDTQDLRPGDLVFFNTLKRAFSHVGIYLGDNKFIHSPTPGSNVRIESMDLKYWKARFNGARRINDPEQQ
jgi:cell wall-associated NlpC family hydrolase